MSHVLVIGATGHVGSQTVRALSRRGHRVRALVRRPGTTVHDAAPDVEHVAGDLRDTASLTRALAGIDVVVSTANAIIPAGRAAVTQTALGAGYQSLIREAERAGVRQFVQSSVPSHALETVVPELAAKRAIETRLAASTISETIVRNPAFMDVWLVMTGARQAIGADPHATARRAFGFMKQWQRLTGDLVADRGRVLAPGGSGHGSVFIATRDVAEMLAGVVDHPDAMGAIIEAGGPEWVTWAEIADLLAAAAGRPVRTLPMPASVAAAGQAMLRPFAPAASGVLGLVRFVATWQPRWDSAPVLERFSLPRQLTVAEYLETAWNDS